MPRINPDRLLNDLKTLRTFGATGTGVVRPTLSAIDMEARHWLAEQMAAAGLEPTIDGVGNVLGRSQNPGQAVLLGSHTDTQPTGGWLDGVLGVLYGLETARALAEDPATAHLPVDVISFADEESTFLSFMGSRAYCGFLGDDEIETATSRHDGRSLRQSWAEAGLSDRPRLQFDPERTFAYVEAHIEQGPYLEWQEKQIGVVTSIVGSRGFTISFHGEQNHAGTTPMAYRRDAGMQLIKFAHMLNERAEDLSGEATVWTIGKVEFEPGASSIVPGHATMLWQFRDQDERILDKIEAMTLSTIAEFNDAKHVRVTAQQRGAPPRAAAMDESLQNHLAAAAEKNCPGKWVRMPSGAAHDAQIMALRVPTAMLFIPSINGISHSFDEDSHEEDIIMGGQVMADAVAAILEEGLG